MPGEGQLARLSRVEEQPAPRQDVDPAVTVDVVRGTADIRVAFADKVPHPSIGRLVLPPPDVGARTIGLTGDPVQVSIVVDVGKRRLPQLAADVVDEVMLERGKCRRG